MDGQTILGITALILGIISVTGMEMMALHKGINGKRLSAAIGAVGGMVGLAFGLGVG